MFKVDSKNLVNTFSDSFDDLMREYKDIRKIVSGLNVDDNNRERIENTRAQLNETVGDFMQMFLHTTCKTNLPNKFVRDDNERFAKNGFDELFGYNEKEKPKKILENSIFEDYEDGLCAKMAHFSNIVKHDLEDLGIVEVANSIGINSQNITNIKTRLRGGDKQRTRGEIIGTLKYANAQINKSPKLHLDVLEEALSDPHNNKKTIDNLQNLMKYCGMSNLSLNNAKEFVNLIKCYKLNIALTNLKELGIRGTIYNIQAKDKLAQMRLERNPKANIKDLEHEVLVGYYTEPTANYKINGKPATRLVIAGKDDRFSMQFHQSKYSMDKLRKDFKFKVKEDEMLKDKLSVSLPYREDNDLEKISNYKNNVDRTILDKLKDAGFGIYNSIKKGYIGKLIDFNKNKHKEDNSIEEVMR